MLSSRLTEGELLLSIFHEGIAGALAGGLQVIFLMWLRTTTRYQHKYGLSLRDAMRDLYRQGGCKRFYKGIGFAFLQAPLSKFCSGKYILFVESREHMTLFDSIQLPQTIAH